MPIKAYDGRFAYPTYERKMRMDVGNLANSTNKGMTSESSILNDVLVVTTKKSFWASEESEVFPHRMFSWIIYGHSTNKLNSLLLFIRVLGWIVIKKPKLIFVGSAIRVGQWLVWVKKTLGLHIKLIVTNRFFPDSLAPYIDRCLVYEKHEIQLYGDPHKYVFTPLPPDGNFQRDCTPASPPYIFSGGSQGRDFGTLFEAVNDLPIGLRIVTHSPKTLNYDQALPANCLIEYVMPLDEYLERIARSLFVVVPLKEGKKPRGQTTILQAMSLGKCVITNDIPANWDYISHESNGILLPPENAESLRTEIINLLEDSPRRDRIGKEAKTSSTAWTYKGFCRVITHLCETVLNEEEV